MRVIRWKIGEDPRDVGHSSILNERWPVCRLHLLLPISPQDDTTVYHKITVSKPNLCTGDILLKIHQFYTTCPVTIEDLVYLSLSNNPEAKEFADKHLKICLKDKEAISDMSFIDFLGEKRTFMSLQRQGIGIFSLSLC
jgi:hypothetical protein